jgi:hypothetical protein
MYPVVELLGELRQIFQVIVEIEDNVAKFTDGWDQFAASEKIVKGCVGRFTLQGDHKMKTTLYAPKGKLKPLADRPSIWTREVAQGNLDHMDQRYQVMRHRVVGHTRFFRRKPDASHMWARIRFHIYDRQMSVI